MTIQEQDRFSEVLQKVSELAQKAAGGDYLYRGEPECYTRVSSSLYRKYSEIDAEFFDVKIVQEEILKEAKGFIRETDDDAILEQLQHFGYPTNQIDFTKDYNIALFFACDSQLVEDGRVLLLKKADRDDLYEPKSPENRVIAQKSVFVRPHKGVVDPDDTVVIPKELKRPILEYLDRSHGVNAAGVFNDIHGFVKYRTVHESDYAEFYTGLTYSNKGKFDKAIKHYSKSIDLNSQMPTSHFNRGNDYWRIGEYDRAIQDYDKAIELDPWYTLAYCNRGNAHMRMSEFDRAIQDYDRVVELDPSFTAAYTNRGFSYMNKGVYDRAIQDYDKVVQLDPGETVAYTNRGVVNFHKGDYDCSIQDFDKAIEIAPENALAYYLRSLSWLCLERWETAESDLAQAQSLGYDIEATFCDGDGSVADFEQKYRVQLPENIKTMLTPKQ